MTFCAGSLRRSVHGVCTEPRMQPASNDTCRLRRSTHAACTERRRSLAQKQSVSGMPQGHIIKRKRNMKRNFQSSTGICLLSLLTSLFTGCTDSMPEQGKGPGEIIECTFRLETGTPVSVETRAIDQSTINDVWVVQLNAEGTTALVAPAQVVPDANKAIRIKLKNETSKLYFFANTGNAAFFNTGDALSSFTTNAVEGKTISRTESWAAMSYVPMYGTWAGKPAPPEITDEVELTRALAQVDVTVTNSTGGKLSISSMQLKKHPERLEGSNNRERDVPCRKRHLSRLSDNLFPFRHLDCRRKLSRHRQRPLRNGENSGSDIKWQLLHLFRDKRNFQRYRCHLPLLPGWQQYERLQYKKEYEIYRQHHNQRQEPNGCAGNDGCFAVVGIIRFERNMGRW